MSVFNNKGSEKSRRSRSALDIAIVGMACRFPGAPDLSAFWHNIQNAVDATSDVPPDRWNAEEFHRSGARTSDRVDSRRGGYLDSPVPFNASAFGIAPSSVDGGEPEQYLVLEAARTALFDAGLPPGMSGGKRVDVIIGRGNGFNRGRLTRLQHGRVLSQTLHILRSLHPDWPDSNFEAIRAELKTSLPPFGPDTIPGQMTNAIAGRIANRLNLQGSSFVVDAASASALVAMDLGARALKERRADLVLVGAAYLQADVDFPMVFQQLGSLSKKGVSRPFSEDADGLVPGEGCGVVVLKRLADAERDGQRVYSVIKGVGLSSDGRATSLASPNARGHALAMKRAYRQARIDPSTVELIETHGLGVPASDRAELEAIRKVFGHSKSRTISAISSMIGHAMPAAGMAGLIASALALHHRMRPPTIRSGQPHRLLRDDDAPGRLRDSASPWVHGDPASPRRAGVNAFGSSGINAHVILEEHTDSADHPTSPGAARTWDSEAILLGATDRASWLSLARALIDWLEHPGDASLRDLAYTINTDQPAFSFRVGLVVSSFADLKSRLTQLIERLSDPARRSIRDARGAYFWDEPLGGPGRLAFVFPGEGSQYAGMLADLFPHFPELRWPFDHADRVAIERGQSLLPSEILFGDANVEHLWTTSPALSVVLSAQWGLFQLLTRLGLRPDAVAGHSSGELLALGASGSLKIDRAFESRIATLGDMFERLESTGAVPHADLIAVAADRSRVEQSCASLNVSVAMDNCPHQVVVALPADQSAGLLERLRQDGVPCETLPFGRAYHTPAFSSALEPLRQFFETLKIRPPRLPVYSCAIAGRMPDDPADIRRLAVDQWVLPVAFRPTIERMHDDGLRIFVEVGARGLLTSFVEDTLRPRSAFAIAANLPKRSGLTQLNHLVASLFAQGVPLNTNHLYVRRRPRRLDLSRPIANPDPSPTLEIGFPEMRLSENFLNSITIPEGWAGRSTPLQFAPGAENVPPQQPTPARSLDDEAMHAYIRTMDTFLDVQRDVMNAYWDIAETPATPEPQSSSQIVSLLLEKVSVRTGYPLDMLGLDLDLEADLGIDPIQRVEIMGDLQSLDTLPPLLDLDALARARTLREILLMIAPESVSPHFETTFPWLGTIVDFEAGRRLVSERRLDPRLDPVSEHHTLGGRRVSAVDPDRKGLPVVPFTVMAEMLAQAASALVPGMVVVGLKDVIANRWIKYEDSPVVLNIRAEADPRSSSIIRASILNTSHNVSKYGADTPVVEGLVILGHNRPEPPQAEPFTISEAGPSNFTAERLYSEQWLFHGPPLQAVSRVGQSASRGIEGSIRVLPLPLLQPPEGTFAPFRTDFIVLDGFTHLLGCWGLDQLSEGDVVFPLRLGSLQIFGTDPEPGTEVTCQISIDAIERQRIRAHASLNRPDGRVWMRIDGWEDWRFFWPNRYRDVFRAPHQILVGEPLTHPALPRNASAVWLEPPADMGRPIWRDVLEAVQLSPQELSTLRALPGPDRRKTLWLWGRVAAKEAVRRLWLDQGHPEVYPADLCVEPDTHGRPWIHSLLKTPLFNMPSISIAHTEGVALAMAAFDLHARVGIDVERITEREPRFEALAFSEIERALLDQIAGADRAEWIARFWCAKEAVGKATGRGLLVGPASVEIVSADLDGRLMARLGPGLASASPGWPSVPVSTFTQRRSDYIWAWTLGKPASS